MNTQQENFCPDCGEENCNERKPLENSYITCGEREPEPKLFNVPELKAVYKEAAKGRAIRIVDRLQIPSIVKASAAKGESQPLSFRVPDDDKYLASCMKDYLTSQECPCKIVINGFNEVRIEIEPFWAE